MEELVISIVAFIIIYLLYVIFVIRKKSKLSKLEKNSNVLYLVGRYGLDLKKVNLKVLGHIIALTNSFILSITLFVISFVDKTFLKILVCFLMLIPLQFILYHIIGKMYERNGQTKKRGKK